MDEKLLATAEPLFSKNEKFIDVQNNNDKHFTGCKDNNKYISDYIVICKNEYMK